MSVNLNISSSLVYHFQFQEVLFNITIDSIGEETSGEYMLKPFSDMLTYLLSGKLARKVRLLY